jgi:hypothetical protein
MTTKAIKKQFDNYLPLLTIRQQALLLEMVKNILNVEQTEKRVTRKQYNKELKEAVTRIENGEFVPHSQAEKELYKW